MATAEELLSGSTTQDRTFVIDSDLRTIIIPRSITNLGVEYDDDVMRVPFQMPAEYCGIDLTGFKIRINYLNANTEPDVYEVHDATTEDGVITFTWLVGRHAAMYKGDVKFNVCIRDVDSSGNVLREFNTTVATLPILEGLETGEAAIAEYNDIFEQWRANLFGEGESAVKKITQTGDVWRQNVVEVTNQSLNAIGVERAEAVDAVRDASREKANAIVKTARGKTIRVDDSSADYIRGFRVLGRTTPVGYSGKNQVDMIHFEFTDSTEATHRHPFTTGGFYRSARWFYNFLLANPGKTIVVSMTRTGTSTGVDIGTIEYYVAGGSGSTDMLLFSITPNTPFVIPSLPGDWSYALIYGSTSGASINDIQVEFGEVPTEYEPYCGGIPTPNPEYPVLPKSLKSGVVATLSGKNLIPYPYSDTTKTVDGVTFVDNGDGSITANGTATRNAVFYFTNVGNNHYVDGTVHLSGCPSGGSVSGNGYSIRLNIYQNGVETSGIVDTGSGKSGTFENALARIYFVVLEGGTVNNLVVRPMLEYGDTQTEYTQYVAGSVIRLDSDAALDSVTGGGINGLPVTSGGTYTDESGQQWLCDEVDFARAVVVRRIGVKKLDGTIPYQQAGTQVPGTYTAFASFDNIWIDEHDRCISDGFPCYPSDDYRTSNKEGIYTNPGTANCNLIIVRLSNDRATDMNSFIQFMTDHPIHVYAPLKAPTETAFEHPVHITSWFEKAKTIKSCTSVSNNKSAFMELDYNADTETYVKNLVDGASGGGSGVTITDDGDGHVTITI